MTAHPSNRAFFAFKLRFAASCSTPTKFDPRPTHCFYVFHQWFYPAVFQDHIRKIEVGIFRSTAILCRPRQLVMPSKLVVAKKRTCCAAIRYGAREA
jgi:hypothetical protein